MISRHVELMNPLLHIAQITKEKKKRFFIRTFSVNVKLNKKSSAKFQIMQMPQKVFCCERRT